MKWFFIVSTVILSLVFVGLFFYSLPGPGQPRLTQEAVAGKRVWQKNDCVDCHTILGNGAYYASDLTRVARQRSTLYLEKYLTSGPPMAPAKHRPHPKLKKKDVGPLLSFLRYVDGLNNHGWPPPPKFRPVAVKQGRPEGAVVEPKSSGGRGR